MPQETDGALVPDQQGTAYFRVGDPGVPVHARVLHQRYPHAGPDLLSWCGRRFEPQRVEPADPRTGAPCVGCLLRSLAATT
ncbi:hypothetical protein IQ251_02680 [Saccharopolyspora sp. HNM0983]|uniref:Uncharacterized protein n=1 Tax=Saccharopolyspora montiporae TaxID=2781240 RepID=A0A929FYF8_9PSEU|nr:hypothetical protein [Saccharopolyspora sp. HNM0983]MBE9373344.1 hypothetical protein [Saccharopolyspora sp. HNM0983]